MKDYLKIYSDGRYGGYMKYVDGIIVEGYDLEAKDYFLSTLWYRSNKIDFRHYKIKDSESVEKGDYTVVTNRVSENPLIDKYNPRSIKNFIESKDRNPLEIIDYLLNMFYEFAKYAEQS